MVVALSKHIYAGKFQGLLTVTMAHFKMTGGPKGDHQVPPPLHI
jgi:hypothetical protein